MTEIGECPNVRKRAVELGVEVPSGIAVLPGNYHAATSAAELVHENSAATVRALWREAGIAETRVEPTGTRLPRRVHQSFEWLGPVVYIGYSVWAQDPKSVTLALEVISNYLSESFRGVIPERKAHLDVVVETTPGGECRRIHYEGPPEGLREIPKIARGMVQGDKR